MSKKTIYDLLEALDISADDLLLIGTADGERKVRAAVLLGEMSGVEFATLSDVLEGTRTDVAINPARGVDLVDAWETKPPAFASEQESIDGQRDDVTISPATQKAAIDEALQDIDVDLPQIEITEDVTLGEEHDGALLIASGDVEVDCSDVPEGFSCVVMRWTQNVTFVGADLYEAGLDRIDTDGRAASVTRTAKGVWVNGCDDEA